MSAGAWSSILRCIFFFLYQIELIRCWCGGGMYVRYCLARRVILLMPCCRTALRVLLPDHQGRLIDNDEIIEPVFFLPSN